MTDKGFRKYGLRALLLIFVLAVLFCPGGIVDYFKVKRDIALKEATIRKVEAENGVLRKRIECLEKDDRCLEEVARGAGLVRDGERLVHWVGK